MSVHAESGQPLELLQNRTAPQVVGQADREVPAPLRAQADQLPLVVGVVRAKPHRRPRRQHPRRPVQQPAPVQRHPAAARLQLARRPKAAQERRVQPVAPVAVAVLPGPLEELPVHLDAGGVDEQRHVALRPNLVLDDGRRHPAGELDRRPPQPLHVAWLQAPEPLPGAPRLRNLAKAEKRAGHPVRPQRVQVAQRPVAPGQRRDDGPQRLRVRRAPVPDLHRDRLPKQFEQPEPLRGLRQDRRAAERRQVQVRELELHLRRADPPLPRRLPRPSPALRQGSPPR